MAIAISTIFATSAWLVRLSSLKSMSLFFRLYLCCSLISVHIFNPIYISFLLGAWIFRIIGKVFKFLLLILCKNTIMRISYENSWKVLNSILIIQNFTLLQKYFYIWNLLNLNSVQVHSQYKEGKTNGIETGVSIYKAPHPCNQQNKLQQDNHLMFSLNFDNGMHVVINLFTMIVFLFLKPLFISHLIYIQS